MTDVKPKTPKSSGKGSKFFDRGDEVAETGNWDFAIKMYLEGLRREPDNLERGHRPLREVALKRAAQGGKSAGIMEKLKHAGGKEPLDAMLNAEYLLAKEPGSISHMVALHKAARKLDEPVVVKWVGEIVLEVMRQAKKPNKQICQMLANDFQDIEEYDLAVAACDVALQAFPNDGELGAMAKNLSASSTIKHGRYDGESDFTKSVADMDKQMALSQKDHYVQQREVLERDIQQAQAEYEESPNVPGKIDALVDALLKIEEEAFENTAVEVLEKAYRESKAYRFKMRRDDVRIRQMKRRYRELREAGEEAQARAAAKALLDFELGSYAERAANYPTDYAIKFELGRRQLLVGQIEEAISSLQQAQRDARHRIQALNLLGKAFARKGWHRQAVENYEKALQFEPREERSKELHYNLAEALETMGDKEKALDHLSAVAQMEYTYKDVRDRVERLRKELEAAPPANS